MENNKENQIVHLIDSSVDDKIKKIKDREVETVELRNEVKHLLITAQKRILEKLEEM